MGIVILEPEFQEQSQSFKSNKLCNDLDRVQDTLATTRSDCEGDIEACMEGLDDISRDLVKIGNENCRPFVAGETPADRTRDFRKRQADMLKRRDAETIDQTNTRLNKLIAERKVPMRAPTDAECLETLLDIVNRVAAIHVESHECEDHEDNISCNNFTKDKDLLKQDKQIFNNTCRIVSRGIEVPIFPPRK